MATSYLNHSGGNIAFDVTGSGPLVICTPGMGDLRGEYRFLTPILVEAGYRVATMDVRGHGETSTAWSDFSAAAVGADILALARHLGGPALLVGTSMAAAAAVWAAAEAPDLIAGLVMIGPFVRGDPTDLLPRLSTRLMRGVLSAALARPWGPGVWHKQYASLYPSRKPADLEAYSQALKDNLTQPGRIEALRAMMATPKDECERRLAALRAPALVLMGSRDPDFKNPESEAAWVAGQVRGSYCMIDGAGHYPQAEFPEVAAPLILSFFQSIPEAAHAV